MRRVDVALLLALLAASPAWADGLDLFAQERFAEAVDAFAAEGGNQTVQAAALIRLGRMDDARRLTDDADPRVALGRAAAAMSTAGEIGRAARLLDNGLERWPDDIDLLVRRGELDANAGRPIKALAYFSRVVELAPADAGARLALARMLLAAGMPVRAHQAVEAARHAKVPVDATLVETDLAALQAYGNHRTAIDVGEDYLDHGGAATIGILRLLASSFDAVGSQAKADAMRKTVATMTAPHAAAGADAPPRGLVAKARYQWARQAGDVAQAAVAVAEWAWLRPDDIDAVRAMLSADIAERLGWGVAFAQVHRLVERDPFDPARRIEAIRAHAGPGGSSVLALVHAHALDSLGQATDPAVKEGRDLRDEVFGRLRRLGRIAELDLDQGSIRLIPEDGPAVDARIDLRSGRLIRLSEGFERMEATWDEAGARLVSLRDSAGGALAFDWSGGRLTQVRRTGAHPFEVALGLDGQPEAAFGTGAAPAFNAAVGLLAAWQKADIAEGRRLRIGP